MLFFFPSETDSWKGATVLQQSWGTIMSTNDCREFYTNFHRKQYAAKLPNDVVTDKSICFAGGPDSTVSTCHVSSPAFSYQQIVWRPNAVTIKGR